MKKIQDFKLSFTKPKYLSGETLSGEVSFELTEEVHTTSLAVSLEGVESAFEKSSDIIKKNLLNLHSVNPRPGLHKLNFQVALPLNLPSSFKVRIRSKKSILKKLPCGVNYFIQARIEFKDCDEKQEVKMPFELTQNLDLNYLDRSHLSSPFRAEAKLDMMNLMSLQTGKVYAWIELKRIGFVIGETVELSIKIDNMCNKILRNIQIGLVRKTTCKSENAELVGIEKTQVSTIKIEAFEKKSWIEFFKLPDELIPTLVSAKFFEVNYFLTLNIEAARKKENRFLQVPVKIGLVPVLEMTDEEMVNDINRFIAAIAGF